MIKLKFESIRRGNGFIIITRGTKSVQCLEDHCIEYRMPYDDISITEGTVLELPITTFDELMAFSLKYNAVVTCTGEDFFVEFLG